MHDMPPRSIVVHHPHQIFWLAKNTILHAWLQEIDLYIRNCCYELNVCRQLNYVHMFDDNLKTLQTAAIHKSLHNHMNDS